MEIKNIENLYNLEDTVGLLVDKANFNFLGFDLKDQVESYDKLPATGEKGAVYAVGTAAPYTYYTYVKNEWLNLGVWPLKGPKGNPGDQGPQGPIGPVGAKGDKGDQGIAGSAGNGLGVNYITKLDLATGDASIAYDKTSGAALAKSGQITAAGNKYDISVIDKLPIIPGDNIDIYTNGTNNALKIGAKVPVTSVNGQKGDVRLTIPTSTSQLVNDAEFITAEYHDNTKQDTLVSGQNIKTINNQSIVGPGNISISGGGGVTSLNGKTGAVTLAEGSNVTISESGNTITISASGGGGGGSSSDGFNNLKELILTPSTYVNNTPAGDFYFEGNGTFKLKDSSPATGIESIKVQLPVVPGDGIIFDKTTDGNCKIKAADYKPTLTLETHTASQNTSYYGRIYYTFNVDNTVANDVANGKYNVIIYDETSGGGYYYCPLQGENMTFLGEEVPNNDSKPSSIVGWSFKAKESTTVVSFWRDSLRLSDGGGGSSASIYQHTITMQGSQYKYKITVVNPYQGSITSPSIWKEIYGTNKFATPAIVTDSTDHTIAISSVYVGINTTNSLSILFWPAKGTSQYSEVISSGASWEDHIISF